MKKVRYRVLYEDEKGIFWYRGKESGLYEYDDAIKYMKELEKKGKYKNIQCEKITEISEIVHRS